jgi:biopolymer transport protein ExbD
MITRPLDLASRLQPEPRNFDALFYVNVALVALFFTLFGSRFVLSPGIQLPVIAGARAGAIPTETVIRVRGSGQLLTADGLLPEAQLPTWLQDQARLHKHPALLIEADTRAATGAWMRIVDLARSAGFVDISMAADEPATFDEGKP